MAAAKDTQPLLQDEPSTPASGYSMATLLKYGSLGFLIIQNSSHVLLLRYSRVTTEPACANYVTSVAVLFAELFKLVFCLVVLTIQERGPLSMLSRLREDIWDRKWDTLKVSVPALCYTVQNNLQFIAASHLGAALLMLLYQTKTLTTAIMGVIILGRTLRCNQWLALTILVAGVVIAQSSQSGSANQNKGVVLIGVLAAVGVSVCSSFASVYLEKILKGDSTSLWVRNVQLCLFAIPLQLLAVYQRDWAAVQANGWLHGFCTVTWLVVSMFAFGGLLVAMVIRFADNNLKNLAMAFAIIVSCLASIPIFGFQPNGTFGGGALLVIVSMFLYAWQPAPPKTELYLPVSVETPTKS